MAIRRLLPFNFYWRRTSATWDLRRFVMKLQGRDCLPPFSGISDLMTKLHQASGRTIFLVLLVSLSGCGVLGSAKRLVGLGPPHASLRSLTIAADSGANGNSGTELDVVVVYGQDALAHLPKSGPDWFRQRAELQLAFARDLESVALQVPAPSATFNVRLPAKTRSHGLAVVVYANYVDAEGWPPVTLTSYRHAALQLQARTIAVSGQPGN